MHQELVLAALSPELQPGLSVFYQHCVEALGIPDVLLVEFGQVKTLLHFL